MEIIDNRKQKQDEPFEITIGYTVFISNTLYRFTPIGSGKFMFISMKNCSWFCSAPHEKQYIMSNDPYLNGYKVTRVKAKVIIED